MTQEESRPAVTGALPSEGASQETGSGLYQFDDSIETCATCGSRDVVIGDGQGGYWCAEHGLVPADDRRDEDDDVRELLKDVAALLMPIWNEHLWAALDLEQQRANLRERARRERAMYLRVDAALANWPAIERRRGVAVPQAGEVRAASIKSTTPPHPEYTRGYESGRRAAEALSRTVWRDERAVQAGGGDEDPIPERLRMAVVNLAIEVHAILEFYKESDSMDALAEACAEAQHALTEAVNAPAGGGLRAARCAESYCDHLSDRHAENGELCYACLEHYAAPVMGLAAHAFALGATPQGETK